MSPSPASAPRRRGAPDAFGAVRLLYEKTAGRSCRRRARTTFHSTTGATALPRAPSDKELRPTGFLPFLDRPPAATPGHPRTALTPAGFARPDRRRSVPPKDPMRTGRQVLLRAAWPPISTTGAGRTEMRQLQRPTPDSPPWEGPRPPADPRHPTLSLLGRAATGARPDALAYWWNSDPNPSSQQPVSRYNVADSCAWIPKQRTIHRPLIHGIVHKAAVALT